MAFKMSYIDETGTQYPESYWKISKVVINNISKTGQVEFVGFKDKAAREEEKKPFDYKRYEISPETYEAYFSPDELSPEGRNPFKASYSMITSDEFFADSFFQTAEMI